MWHVQVQLSFELREQIAAAAARNMHGQTSESIGNYVFKIRSENYFAIRYTVFLTILFTAHRGVARILYMGAGPLALPSSPSNFPLFLPLPRHPSSLPPFHPFNSTDSRRYKPGGNFRNLRCTQESFSAEKY